MSMLKTDPNTYWILKLPLEVIASDASFSWGNARTQTVLLATKRSDQQRQRLNTHLDLANDASDYPCKGLFLLSRATVNAKTEKLQAAWGSVRRLATSRVAFEVPRPRGLEGCDPGLYHRHV